MSESSTVYTRIQDASCILHEYGWDMDQQAILIAALIQKGWL